VTVVQRGTTKIYANWFFFLISNSCTLIAQLCTLLLSSFSRGTHATISVIRIARRKFGAIRSHVLYMCVCVCVWISAPTKSLAASKFRPSRGDVFFPSPSEYYRTLSVCIMSAACTLNGRERSFNIFFVFFIDVKATGPVRYWNFVFPRRRLREDDAESRCSRGRYRLCRVRVTYYKSRTRVQRVYTVDAHADAFRTRKSRTSKWYTYTRVRTTIIKRIRCRPVNECETTTARVIVTRVHGTSFPGSQSLSNCPVFASVFLSPRVPPRA